MIFLLLGRTAHPAEVVGFVSIGENPSHPYTFSLDATNSTCMITIIIVNSTSAEHFLLFDRGIPLYELVYR